VAAKQTSVRTALHRSACVESAHRLASNQRGTMFGTAEVRLPWISTLKIRRAQICVVVVGLCPESLVPGVVVELVGSEPLPELRQPEHIHGVSSTDCASNHIHASGSFLEGSSWWVVKSQTLPVQTIGRLRNIRPPPACSIGGRSGKSIKVATLSRSPLSAASLEPAARSDRRHGRRFLTYQRTVTMSSATRETGTRARGAAGSPPASLWTKRTCCDDQK
jgi:hypothetical protein